MVYSTTCHPKMKLTLGAVPLGAQRLWDLGLGIACEIERKGYFVGFEVNCQEINLFLANKWLLNLEIIWN